MPRHPRNNGRAHGTGRTDGGTGDDRGRRPGGSGRARPGDHVAGGTPARREGREPLHARPQPGGPARADRTAGGGREDRPHRGGDRRAGGQGRAGRVRERLAGVRPPASGPLHGDADPDPDRPRAGRQGARTAARGRADLRHAARLRPGRARPDGRGPAAAQHVPRVRRPGGGGRVRAPAFAAAVLDRALDALHTLLEQWPPSQESPSQESPSREGDS